MTNDKSGLNLCSIHKTELLHCSISGETIHRALRLPVQHQGHVRYRKLSSLALKEMRQKWQNTVALIIDEVSMVSAASLEMISRRLMEIRGNTEPFGGISLCVFGDMYQLPAVRARQIFTSPLWAQFHLIELTINMRQRGDRVSFICSGKLMYTGKCVVYYYYYILQLFPLTKWISTMLCIMSFCYCDTLIHIIDNNLC